MTGKVEHLGGDRWRIRQYVGTDPVTGRQMQRSRTFRANGERAAAKIAIRERAALAAEIASERDRALTLAGLIDRYEAHKLQRGDWSPSTARRNRKILADITADLGRVMLDRLTARDVDGWYSTLTARGLAAQTVTQYGAVLRAVLRQGDRWDMSTDRATRKATLPKVRRPEVVPPPDEVVRLLLNAATGSLRAALAIAITGGLRRGEIVGLRWSDFDGRTLTVQRSVLDMPDGGVFVKSTKSGRPRRMRVDPILLDVLADHRARMEDTMRRYAVEPPPDWFVLPNLRKDPSGQTPMRPDWLSLAWGRHRKAHGAASVRLHHLRHWNLSTLANAGVPMATVQARGGHADLETTGIYTHALPAGDATASGVIERALEEEQ